MNTNDEYTLTLINNSQGKLEENLSMIPEEIINMDIVELERKIKPTDKERALKLQVQREISRATMSGSVINLTNMCRGVYTVKHFRENIITRHDLLAWLISPETEDRIQLQLLSNKGLEYGREVLNMDDSGDIKKMEFKWKVAKAFIDRAWPVVNRSEIAELKLKKDLDKGKPEELECEIEELKKELGYDGSIKRITEPKKKVKVKK